MARMPGRSPSMARAGRQLVASRSEPTLRLYHVGRTRGRADLRSALATQEPKARLRRLNDLLQDDFHGTLRMRLARSEASLMHRRELPVPPILTQSASKEWRQQQQQQQQQVFPLAIEASSAPLLDLSTEAAEHSALARVLRERPGLVESLAGLVTGSGFTVHRCLQPTLAAPQQSVHGGSGIVAGDAECYRHFGALFEPVAARLMGLVPGALPERHAQNLDYETVPREPVDKPGKIALQAFVEIRRNLRSLPFPPGCTKIQRRVAEQTLAAALHAVLGGSYHPAYAPRGAHRILQRPVSESFDALSPDDLAFPEPRGASAEAAGLRRDWPDGRGVFVNSEQDVIAWLNEEDHLRLRSLGYHAGDLRGAFRRLCKAERALSQYLENCQPLAWDDKFGWLTVRPENAGTALHAEIVLSLRGVGNLELADSCRDLGLSAERSVRLPGRGWRLWNAKTLGSGEAEQVSAVFYGARTIVEAEYKFLEGI